MSYKLKIMASKKKDKKKDKINDDMETAAKKDKKKGVSIYFLRSLNCFFINIIEWKYAFHYSLFNLLLLFIGYC